MYFLFFQKCCFLLINISLKTARHATTLGSLYRDRIGVHHHPSLGALCAVCRVSRVHVPCVMRYVFLYQKQSAGLNCFGQMLGVFCSYIEVCISLKRARLAATLGSSCRDRLGVHYRPSLGVLRAVCRESHVHVPCGIRYFFFKKKKSGRRFKLLGCNLSLRTRVRAPASVPFCFFFRLPFFLC